MFFWQLNHGFSDFRKNFDNSNNIFNDVDIFIQKIPSTYVHYFLLKSLYTSAKKLNLDLPFF